MQKHNKRENQHKINIQWIGDPVSFSQDADIHVEVLSRKIKNEVESPSDILFRTHHYEFVLRPTAGFFNWACTRAGFIVTLELMQQKSDDKSLPFDDRFIEFTHCGVPVVTFSYTENIPNSIWILDMYWPENRELTWKGLYCFRLNIYKRVQEDTYRKITSKISSTFTILSKPQVFLKQKNRYKQKQLSDNQGKKRQRKSPTNKKTKKIKTENTKTVNQQTIQQNNQTTQDVLIQPPKLHNQFQQPQTTQQTVQEEGETENAFFEETKEQSQTDSFDLRSVGLAEPNPSPIFSKHDQHKFLDEIMKAQYIKREDHQSRVELPDMNALFSSSPPSSALTPPPSSPSLRLSQEIKLSQESKHSLLSINFSQESTGSKDADRKTQHIPHIITDIFNDENLTKEQKEAVKQYETPTFFSPVYIHDEPKEKEA